MIKLLASKKCFLAIYESLSVFYVYSIVMIINFDKSKNLTINITCYALFFVKKSL